MKINYESNTMFHDAMGYDEVIMHCKTGPLIGLKGTKEGKRRVYRGSKEGKRRVYRGSKGTTSRHETCLWGVYRPLLK
jgi:hypothetical protein